MESNEYQHTWIFVKKENKKKREQNKKEKQRETKKEYPWEKSTIYVRFDFVSVYKHFLWYTQVHSNSIPGYNISSSKQKTTKNNKKKIFFKSIFFQYFFNIFLIFGRTPQVNIVLQHHHVHNIFVVHIIVENVHMDIVQQ